jgi:hypothetical protein
LTPEDRVNPPSRAAASPASAFGALARAAIEKHVGEARTAGAHWTLAPNVAWVRWARAEGDFFYLAVRRHLDWVSGEAGISREAVALDQLPQRGSEDPVPEGPGYRVRLGFLLHGEDRWWPAGTTVAQQREQLEWLVLQLRVKAETEFRRHPLRQP